MALGHDPLPQISTWTRCPHHLRGIAQSHGDFLETRELVSGNRSGSGLVDVGGAKNIQKRPGKLNEVATKWI